MTEQPYAQPSKAYPQINRIMQLRRNELRFKGYRAHPEAEQACLHEGMLSLLGQSSGGGPEGLAQIRLHRELLALFAQIQHGCDKGETRCSAMCRYMPSYDLSLMKEAQVRASLARDVGYKPSLEVFLKMSDEESHGIVEDINNAKHGRRPAAGGLDQQPCIAASVAEDCDPPGHRDHGLPQVKGPSAATRRVNAGTDVLATDGLTTRRIAADKKFRTVDELADFLGVHRNKILGWIASGDLVAVNTSRACNKRPRWRIADDAVQAFLERRLSNPKPTSTSKTRRKQMAGVIEILK